MNGMWDTDLDDSWVSWHNDSRCYIFIAKCEMGEMDNVQSDLDLGDINIAFKDNEALILALEAGHTDIARLLLRQPRVWKDTTLGNSMQKYALVQLLDLGDEGADLVPIISSLVLHLGW
jgi:hypothetical protein